MNRLGALASRVRALDPRRVDLLLAALVLVEGSAEVVTVGAPARDRAIAVGATALVAVGVAARRRAPIAAVVLGFAGLIVIGELDKAIPDGSAGPFFATLFLIFSLAMRTEGRRFAAGAALALALVMLTTGLDQYENAPGEYLFGLALFAVAPLMAGQILHSRTRLSQALRLKAEQLERERRQGSERAAVQERTRIAGELHDVVAHALGAMTVQASAARRLGATNPVQARAALQAVEETGRDALDELRRVLGVLRKEDEELALAPQPTLAHVGSLVRRSGAVGLPATLAVEGAPAAPLSAGVDLTAYRVVQEALAEALDHGAAGRAQVTIRYGSGDVEVVVSDDGSGGARHLLGMRERVRLYGGELYAGRPREGGHRVRARLPLEVQQ